MANFDQHKTCNYYKKGQVIFHEGTRPIGLFCIRSGQVKICRTGLEGKEQIVRLAKSGSIIGYRSFLAEELYSASAIAIEGTTICCIDRDDLNKALASNPLFYKNLVKLMSFDLRKSEDLVFGLAQKSARERLAEVLLLLKEEFGIDPLDSAKLGVQLSRQELSTYTGVATETIIRLLSEFKQEGWVDLQGRQIRILNYKALVDEANLAF
ncbi:MAG: Crp/Fnr family transcriptional regulator [Deltaproteobacteria bacterium]|nr:Crp/Fnr family transcriptional regulator [Deltaproteobacteria bacterium]